MIEEKHILCVDPEPVKLRIPALLNRRGIKVALTAISSQDALDQALREPGRWDLVLCEAGCFFDLAFDERLESIGDGLDASMVLVKPRDSQLSPAEGYRWGAADVVMVGDTDHLLMVCERELSNAVLRRRLRQLEQSGAMVAEATPRERRRDDGRGMVIPTITDLSKGRAEESEPQTEFVAETTVHEAGLPPDQLRIKSLIDDGGLTLEFQPIVPLKAPDQPRSQFEALVRLKDESGELMLPGDFLPTIVQAGWMGKIDLWIYRRALTILEELQRAGRTNAMLFVNLASETLRSSALIKAIGGFTAAARISPGSIVVELHRDAFMREPEGVEQLAELLRLGGHGLLLEDPGVGDCRFLERHGGLMTHIKLNRKITRGLVEGGIDQRALDHLVRCAHARDIRVIALAVESARLLPMLFTAGVDAIQGHFVSMPYQDLMYPAVQRIESESSFIDT
ncbi:EAL domain-containing protein [Marichromatium bheemlicum]|uniref:EAL domain-containing protein n=1 Tax=Marichromatium bheemlicum TaxID=365339 RepID=A0ABX1I7K7_9GAMM|nr:EAL domain-containing protein [Marichromatium bheemlicum]NKN32205.1 EAL domain-containing protein [Marichromatium bheemlicum]